MTGGPVYSTRSSFFVGSIGSVTGGGGAFGLAVAAGGHGQRARQRQSEGMRCVLHRHRGFPCWINRATAAATSSGFSMMDMWPHPSSETWIACGICRAYSAIALGSITRSCRHHSSSAGWRITYQIVDRPKAAVTVSADGTPLDIHFLHVRSPRADAVPLILTWLQTGLVPRFPTAILSAGIGILSGLSLTAGLILETVTIGRRETRHLHYLASGPVPADLLE